MRQLKFTIMGVILLTLLSCSKGGEIALEKYIEEQNKVLPYGFEDSSFDSIRCDKKAKIATQYFSKEGEEGDIYIESLRNQDEELCKKVVLIEFQKDPELNGFLKILELADYSFRIVYTTQDGKPIKTLTWRKEEYSKKIDGAEIISIQKEQLTDEVNSMKATCPSELDETLTLMDVTLDWDINEITFLYKYNEGDKPIDKDSLYSSLRRGAANVELEDFKALNLTTNFKYIFKEDTLAITITPDE